MFSNVIQFSILVLLAQMGGLFVICYLLFVIFWFCDTRFSEGSFHKRYKCSDVGALLFPAVGKSTLPNVLIYMYMSCTICGEHFLVSLISQINLFGYRG